MARNTVNRQDALLDKLRNGKELSFGEQIALTAGLSLPAILAQLTHIVMGYADASMVGRLGAADAASVGLVSTSTWLVWGLLSAAATGFTVQIAHTIGAKDETGARSIVRHGLAAVLAFSLLLSAVCFSISPFLPIWLGGGADIAAGSTRYFRVFSLALPVFQTCYAAGGMLQCSGNIRLPSMINAAMCGLNVLFNFLLIFPSRSISMLGMDVPIPGAGLGITGAALGTALAEAVGAALMLYFLMKKNPVLRLRKGEKTNPLKQELQKAFRIGLPVALEGVMTGGAYVLSTVIIAPLGAVAIAANSFAVTAEGFCYMPGYGIAIAATTIIGQCVGAGRTNLIGRMSRLIVAFGVIVMAAGGVLLYACAPVLIGLMTPDAAIRELGTAVLRIEAFAEPMYAAAIVSGGIFRGAGKTLASSLINLFSMWAVRLPLMAWLGASHGLRGIWAGMCIELCFRGSLFLIMLARNIRRKRFTA